jgi:hypothetical protein
VSVDDADIATDPADTAVAPAAVTTRPRITRRGRWLRLSLVAAAAGLLLYGTVAGHDDMFPFGPFTMYAGYYPPNGVITSKADIGLPRGDIEGELGAYRADPGRFAQLAQAYHDRFPQASPYVEMRIVQKRWQLRHRAVVSVSMVTLVEWRAR